MPLMRIPAVFMRGGTSKAVVFDARDLPPDPAVCDAVFLAAMGSPDPNGRQLDGMGGGISSLSKVCVVGPPTRPDADVDYTFAQIGVKVPDVDYSANCGNMSSAMGPFAVEAGLVPPPPDGIALVRIHNTNTRKIIHSRFPVAGGLPVTEGDLAVDGVAGTGAPVKLEFREPGGARTGRLLPTGNPVDLLDVPGVGPIEMSMVDAANPCVFVAAAAVGMDGGELPDDLEADAGFLARMEAIRQAASVAMGLSPNAAAAAALTGIPKVAMLFAPHSVRTLAGETLGEADYDIGIRMISVGNPHRAVPITGAVCLGVASRVPGTLAERLAAAGDGPVRLGHPSGVVVVDAKVTVADGVAFAEHGAVYRTQRRLFEGNVCVRAEVVEAARAAAREPAAS